MGVSSNVRKADTRRSEASMVFVMCLDEHRPGYHWQLAGWSKDREDIPRAVNNFADDPNVTWRIAVVGWNAADGIFGGVHPTAHTIPIDLRRDTDILANAPTYKCLRDAVETILSGHAVRMVYQTDPPYTPHSDRKGV